MSKFYDSTSGMPSDIAPERLLCRDDEGCWPLSDMPWPPAGKACGRAVLPVLSKRGTARPLDALLHSWTGFIVVCLLLFSALIFAQKSLV